MLLTIHNLPSSTRYADVKCLLKDKCGLTEVIVDNLVNEGKNKKVTVGLATEDDGAFVVRKLNGLFINGQQLYIEDKRRSTSDQPYRPGGLDPVQPDTVMQPIMAPVVPAWNQTISMPYMQPMHVDQTLAYTGYVGVPQAMHYMEPNPVSAQVSGYSGYQAEAYAPNNEPRHQEPIDWGRNSREQPPEAFRNKDRKRRHSPERPAAGSKRSSRLDNFNNSKNRREPSPPRKHWADENRVFQDQFSRQNQNVEPQYRPREPNPDYRQSNPMWERQSRWDDPNPRAESEEQWDNDNRGWEPQPDKAWDDQPQRREEPRQWDNQPKPKWDNRAKPKRDNQPKPQRDNQPKPHWDSPQKPHWDNQPKPQWDNQPKRQWDDQPKPQWKDRVPVENIGSESYDDPAASDAPRAGNDQEFQPRDHGRYRDSRPRNQNFDEPISGPVWTSEPENSFSSSGRPSRPAEESRRNRPRSKNGRQGSDWRDDRPVAPRDRSGGLQKPDYGKPKEYPSREFKRQARPEHGPPKAAPKHERNEAYSANTKKNNLFKAKKTYPPVSEQPVNKPIGVEVRLDKNKPQTLRSMINKDRTYREQATSLIAKKTMGVDIEKPYVPQGPLDSFIFKQLKACIKSRIDVIFGEELTVHMAEVIRRYRAKFPFKDDETFMMQIREKSTSKYEPNQPKEKKNAAASDQLKKEKDTETQNGKEEKKTTAVQQGTSNASGTQNKTASPAPVPVKSTGPPIHPSIAKQAKKKPGAPLTDKQVIQQMKLLRKWEYDQDDIYSMDADNTKALDDEMAELDKLFTEECLNPADQQEAIICKLLTTDSLNDFNKTIRLYITKRILNIETGLAVRMFASGKPPKKEAVLQYLKKHKIQAAAVKKSVKGAMYMVNLTRFRDFDKLCNIDNDAIDGTPINFKAMHLIGPPPKMNKNQVKSMRQKNIENQIKDWDMAELEDVDFGGTGDGVAGGGGAGDTWDGDAGDKSDGAAGDGDAGDKWDGDAGDKWDGDAGDNWDGDAGEKWEGDAEETANGDAGETADGDAGETADGDAGDMDTGFVAEEVAEDNFEGDDFSKDIAETENAIGFADEVNIENINEEDLEDF